MTQMTLEPSFAVMSDTPAQLVKHNQCQPNPCMQDSKENADVLSEVACSSTVCNVPLGIP